MLVATSKFWTVFYLLSEEKPDNTSCLSEEGIVGLLPKAAMETNNNLKPSSFCLMGSKTTVSEGKQYLNRPSHICHSSKNTFHPLMQLLSLEILIHNSHKWSSFWQTNWRLRRVFGLYFVFVIVFVFGLTIFCWSSLWQKYWQLRWVLGLYLSFFLQNVFNSFAMPLKGIELVKSGTYIEAKRMMNNVQSMISL